VILGERPGNWLNRPAVIAAIAFVVGAVIAGVVVALVLSTGGDGEESVVSATRTPAGATASLQTPGVTGTPQPTPSPTTGNPRDVDDALATFVQRELGQPYLGPCPDETTSQFPQGICSIELHRDDLLVTFMLGPPFSEAIGEAVLTPDDTGIWEVTFVERSGEGGLAVGSVAVVFGAGDCLNFREAPGSSAAVLTCQLDGTSAEVIGGPEESGGTTWWQLEGLGWASGQYLLAQ
jgi:hypothetical protein